MIKKGLALVALATLLIGCKPIAFEPEPYEPISSFVTNEINMSESTEDKRPLYESNMKPRQLSVQAKDNFVLSDIVKYCWSEKAGECAGELEHDSSKPLFSSYKQTFIQPSERIIYNLLSSNFGKEFLPFPTAMQLYSYKDDTLTPIGDLVTNTESWEISFQAPAEEGKYVYVLKALYEGDINGVTFYAFEFRVKE